MKKILIVLTLLSFLFGGGVAYAVDSPVEPGVIKRITGASQDTTYRAYKLVRFGMTQQDTASISADSLVIWDVVSDDGVTISETTLSGDGAIAGIVATTIQTSDNRSGTSAADDAGRRNWGYVQVEGKSTVRVLAGGTNNHSAGDMFITSTDASRATSLERVSFDTSGATTVARATVNNDYVTRQLKAAGSRGGFFLDPASATRTTEEVILDLQ